MTEPIKGQVEKKKWQARVIPNFDTSKFYSKVSEKTNTGCLEWEGTITANGYGSICIGGRNFLAHRVSYHLHNNGNISTELLIDHICRNRKCVNPEHLREATHEQNANENCENEDKRKRARNQNPQRTAC